MAEPAASQPYDGDLDLNDAGEAWLESDGDAVVIVRAPKPPPFDPDQAVADGYEWFSSRPQFQDGAPVTVTGKILTPAGGTQDYLFMDCAVLRPAE